MSRRGRVEEDDDAESPPWLAPASADHRRGTVVSSRKLNMWLLLLAGLLLLVIGLIYAQIAKPADDAPAYAGADGEVPLIRAPDTPFKIRPKDPGGLDLEGNNQSAFEAAGGLDPGGELNFDALPEEIVYVGDDPLYDVVGSIEAGYHAVWINRESIPWPQHLPAPDHQVTDLHQLEVLLSD